MNENNLELGPNSLVGLGGLFEIWRPGGERVFLSSGLSSPPSIPQGLRLLGVPLSKLEGLEFLATLQVPCWPGGAISQPWKQGRHCVFVPFLLWEPGTSCCGQTETSRPRHHGDHVHFQESTERVVLLSSFLCTSEEISE